MPDLKTSLMQTRILVQLASHHPEGSDLLDESNRDGAVGALLALVVDTACETAIAQEAAVGLAQVAGFLTQISS